MKEKKTTDEKDVTKRKTTKKTLQDEKYVTRQNQIFYFHCEECVFFCQI